MVHYRSFPQPFLNSGALNSEDPEFLNGVPIASCGILSLSEECTYCSDSLAQRVSPKYVYEYGTQ